MKFAKTTLVMFLVFSLSTILLPVQLVTMVAAQSTQSNDALLRGYRTGYSDGYMAGYRDTIDSLGRDLTRHKDYVQADRAYNQDYGSLADYRDGYQQGFESGYETGFDKRGFDSTLPTDLKKRGSIVTEVQSTSTSADSNAPTATTANPPDSIEPLTDAPATKSVAPIAQDGVTVIIPSETELMLELQDELSTDRSREGDKFTAKVTSPIELVGATIEGRVIKVQPPGRVKGRSEIFLSFDRIMLSDSRWSNFSAILVEVMPVKGDNIKLVDSEGTAVGQSSYKRDAVKIGGATGVGALIGAIFSPVGAAIGAGVGAAFGVGAVVTGQGKQIRLNRNQQLRIRSSYETQIR